MERAAAYLCEVRVVGLPLDEQRHAAEHFDELLREFTLLHLAGSGTGVPTRLIELRDALVDRFQSFTASTSDELVAAIERGDPTVDLIYLVPPEAGPAAQGLLDLMDEVDEFCHAGRHLLTLATPERSVRYRQWFLGEFVRQTAGEHPTSWAEHRG